MSFLLVLLLAACGGDATPDDTTAAQDDRAEPRSKGKRKSQARKKKPAGKPVQLAGVMSFHEEGVVLTPCGEGADQEPVALREGAGKPSKVREELGADADDVYVELRGLRQDDGSVVVRVVDVAIAGEEGCVTPPDARLAAWGAAPPWRFEIEADRTATWDRPGEDAITFTAVERTEDKRPTFRGAGADGVEAVLTLERARCTDAEGTAFYPWQATLTSGEFTSTGCAWGHVPRRKRARSEAVEVEMEEVEE